MHLNMALPWGEHKQAGGQEAQASSACMLAPSSPEAAAAAAQAAHLLACQPLSRVDHQQLLDKILSLRADLR